MSTNLTLADAYAHCRRVTRQRAGNFAYAFVLLPRRVRRAMQVVYAFCRVCDDAVDEAHDAGEATARIAALRQQLADCLAGTADTLEFLALKEVIRDFQLSPQPFNELIDGVERDLEFAGCQTFAQLREYCYGVASTVGLIVIELCGCRHPEARSAAIDLGIAMQLTNILRDLREDAGRGRVYLPQDELQRWTCDPSGWAEGEPGPGFADLMTYQVDRAKRYFEQGRTLLPFLRPRFRCCPAALAALYSAILEHIAADPLRVMRQRVRLSPLRKAALVCGTWCRVRMSGM